jgi:hypothetical protein
MRDLLQVIVFSSSPSEPSAISAGTGDSERDCRRMMMMMMTTTTTEAVSTPLKWHLLKKTRERENALADALLGALAS